MNATIQILVKINDAMMDNDFDLLMDARADLDEFFPHKIDEDEYDVLANHIDHLMLIFNRYI